MTKILQWLKSKIIFQIFTIYLRYLIGGAFVFAAIVKIRNLPFTILSTETEVGHFFDALHRTGEYWQFLGWMQVIAAFFLMTQRWATIGAMLFFGIILNIFIITISVDFGIGTPIITFGMLLAITYLLLWDWNKIRLLFIPEHQINYNLTDWNPGIMAERFWMYLGGILFIISCIFGWNRMAPFLWLLLCISLGLIALILFFIINKNKKQKANLSD